MTGFEVYSKYRRTGGSNQIIFQKNYANEVLFALWNEVCDNEKCITDIDFILYIKEMIENVRYYRKIDESKVYVFDAYIFICALYSCMMLRRYSDSVINEDNLPYLFKPMQLNNENCTNFLNKTLENIKKIESLENVIVDEYLSTKSEIVHMRKTQLFSNGSNSVSLMRKDESPETNIDKVGARASLTSKSSIGYSEEQDTNIKARRENNKKLVEKWHSQVEDISTTLKCMQPDVSKMLENIMGFSDKVTEKYVLQFARMQIELYDFIHDNYQYHYKNSGLSKNQDYINAVANYEEFLYSILDSLAVFGVEEISSCEGDHFDGRIHEAESSDFSSRNAIIKKSIRSGFKYMDVIIQKEKVVLWR